MTNNNTNKDKVSRIEKARKKLREKLKTEAGKILAGITTVGVLSGAGYVVSKMLKSDEKSDKTENQIFNSSEANETSTIGWNAATQLTEEQMEKNMLSEVKRINDNLQGYEKENKKPHHLTAMEVIFRGGNEIVFDELKDNANLAIDGDQVQDKASKKHIGFLSFDARETHMAIFEPSNPSFQKFMAGIYTDQLKMYKYLPGMHYYQLDCKNISKNMLGDKACRYFKQYLDQQKAQVAQVKRVQRGSEGM
ncbi:MAG: hypothetical protein IJ545_03620 [Alphaproteobacteria bacterium]|nr:hypothetical protein [Alphaproteobacteria bacterium]